MARGTLKVGRIVPLLLGAFRGRFELFRTACKKKSKHYPGIEPSIFGVAVGDANPYAIQATCAPLKIDKNFKINHPTEDIMISMPSTLTTTPTKVFFKSI
jgi:hypothetical protein